MLDLYFEQPALVAETPRNTEAVLFLASDKASSITGHIVNVDGGKRAAL